MRSKKYKVARFTGFFNENRITIYDLIELKKHSEKFSDEDQNIINKMILNAMKNEIPLDLLKENSFYSALDFFEDEILFGFADEDSIDLFEFCEIIDNWVVIARPKEYATAEVLKKSHYGNPDLYFTVYKSVELAAQVLTDNFIKDNKLQSESMRKSNTFFYRNVLLEKTKREAVAQITDLLNKNKLDVLNSDTITAKLQSCFFD